MLVTRQSLHARFGISAGTGAGMCDALTDENRQEVEAALISGAMPADAHSVLLAASYQKDLAEMDVGATVELSLGQETVTVTISGLLDPMGVTSNGHGALGLDSVALFAPEELFRELHPEIENFDYSWSIVSDPKKAERVEAGLQEILSGHSNLGLDTIGTHIAYEKMQSGLIFGSMEALSWLIFLFGVVNLINTTLSNQMSRRRENSILRSIGLTSRQLCRMNICEGLCYAVFAALAVLLIGLPIAVAVCREVSRQSFASEIVPYQFPILEMSLFLLVLFGLEFLLSAWTAGRESGPWSSRCGRWNRDFKEHFMTSREHFITRALKWRPLLYRLIKAKKFLRNSVIERGRKHERTDDGWASGRQLQYQAVGYAYERVPAGQRRGRHGEDEAGAGLHRRVY